MEERGFWATVGRQRASRRRLLGAAAAGTGAALVAACGGRTPTNKPASGQSGAGQPRSGGQVALWVPVDPFDWDSSLTGKTSPNGNGIAMAYDRLLSFKFGPDVQYNEIIVQPGLAASYESPDSITYTFNMRPGVKFANLPPVNGRALTSEDVRWSYEYWSRTGQFAGKNLPTGQFQWLFDGLDHIETPDSSTVVVKFKQPFAPFATYAASEYNPIVPHEIYDADGKLSNKIAGTGAWQLDTAASQKGSRWIWTRNPNYYQSGRPYLDKINWLVIPDSSASYAAFETKQLDLLGVADPTIAAQIEKLAPSAVVSQWVQPLVDHLHLNVRKPPLSDLRVRQAIALSINRDEFIKVQTGGKGALGMAGAFYDTFTQDEIRQLLKYDPQSAKQLTAAAGYPDGVELEFNYPGDNAYGDYYTQEMQLFQAQMKQGGINLTLKPLDKNDYSARRKKGDFVIELLPTQPAGEDIGSLLYAIFVPNQQSNYGGVNDPPLTALIQQQQQQEHDNARRKDLIRQAAKRINAEQFWAQGPYHRIAFEFRQPRIQNYAPNFGAITPPLIDSWVNA